MRVCRSTTKNQHDGRRPQQQQDWFSLALLLSTAEFTRADMSPILHAIQKSKQVFHLLPRERIDGKYLSLRLIPADVFGNYIASPSEMTWPPFLPGLAECEAAFRGKTFEEVSDPEESAETVRFYLQSCWKPDLKKVFPDRSIRSSWGQLVGQLGFTLPSPTKDFCHAHPVEKLRWVVMGFQKACSYLFDSARVTKHMASKTKLKVYKEIRKVADELGEEIGLKLAEICLVGNGEHHSKLEELDKELKLRYFFEWWWRRIKLPGIKDESPLHVTSMWRSAARSLVVPAEVIDRNEADARIVRAACTGLKFALPQNLSPSFDGRWFKGQDAHSNQRSNYENILYTEWNAEKPSFLLDGHLFQSKGNDVRSMRGAKIVGSQHMRVTCAKILTSIDYWALACDCIAKYKIPPCGSVRPDAPEWSEPSAALFESLKTQEDIDAYNAAWIDAFVRESIRFVFALYCDRDWNTHTKFDEMFEFGVGVPGQWGKVYRKYTELTFAFHDDEFLQGIEDAYLAFLQESPKHPDITKPLVIDFDVVKTFFKDLEGTIERMTMHVKDCLRFVPPKKKNFAEETSKKETSKKETFEKEESEKEKSV